MAPNDRVVEMKLARKLNVSSIPVREAIRELVAMGVLEYSMHKGARVRVVSMAETIHALQVRSALEPLAVSLAGDALRAKCAELREAVEGITAAARERDFRSYQRHNQKFHRTIVESSGNQILLKLWDLLAYEVRAQAIMEYMDAADPIFIASEHSAILNALEGGHFAAAASLLASHCWHLIEYLRKSASSGDAAAGGGGESETP